MRSDLIEKALAALQQDCTLLYPTDTIWGVGCDACRFEAVEKIYALKERDHSKSMLVLANEDMLSPTIPSTARELLLQSQRPTTVIIDHALLSLPLAENLFANDGSIGVRVPRFDFCETLLARLGHPIVSTSANLSGKPSPRFYEEIAQEVKDRVDLALPNDPSFIHDPTGSSRIVKMENNGEIVVLRN